MFRRKGPQSNLQVQRPDIWGWYYLPKRKNIPTDFISNTVLPQTLPPPTYPSRDNDMYLCGTACWLLHIHRLNKTNFPWRAVTKPNRKADGNTTLLGDGWQRNTDWNPHSGIVLANSVPHTAAQGSAPFYSVISNTQLFLSLSCRP